MLKCQIHSLDLNKMFRLISSIYAENEWYRIRNEFIWGTTIRCLDAFKGCRGRNGLEAYRISKEQVMDVVMLVEVGDEEAESRLRWRETICWVKPWTEDSKGEKDRTCLILIVSLFSLQCQWNESDFLQQSSSKMYDNDEFLPFFLCFWKVFVTEALCWASICFWSCFFLL